MTNAEGRAEGTFYALGLGPGDPDLMTVRAQTLLRCVPTVCAPVRRAGGQSYALQIAGGLIDPLRQHVETLAFPESGAGWRDHVEHMVGRLAHGDVALVTEGDPLLYSTFIGVLHELQERHPRVRVSIVPGVASPMAAAAAAGIALADDDQRLAILPAMYALDALSETLTQFDTVVLLKVSGVLDAVLDCLERAGAGRHVAHVRRVGRPEQSVLTGVERIRLAPAAVRDDYLSLLIVTRGVVG
jgi:precorrin-2/cobalt-factor-2 C20-methyltransferase